MRAAQPPRRPSRGTASGASGYRTARRGADYLVAAAVLLAFTLAGAAYLSQRTKAAAHEAMVLDHVAIWSQTLAFAADPISDERQSEQQVRLAQWVADDLRGRQEER